VPHRHHVLLVEDHDEVREALEMSLQVLGVLVSAVDNARDALALLRKGLGCCVILLDWRMPEMDGEGFLRARMEDAPLVGTPVVAVTGDGLRPERAMKLGIREVVRKPVDPAAVLAAVARHCAKGDESD